ncbi:MAG: AAA-like domain-containing protein [Gammaproteobacteria bacterium]|nr:AAA-like domain-containing protein [Gammaproteobacteria bacterium]
MTGNSDEKAPGAERSRLDTTGEFFSVGTPLHAVRAGYVRRAADDVLYETLVAGRYAHIIAPDRSGKSSLVAATAARLENNGFKVAILDLEQIGVRDAGGDAGRWYYSVAYRLLRQLRIRVDLQSWWQDKSILSNRQRLVEFYSEVVLRNVQERVVVFVDEIQCIGDLPFADQLLASIRAAHNARATDPEFSRLSFVLLGECDPLSLLDEPELSPFNITQPVALGDFSRADLDLYTTELNMSPDNATAALDRIYYWTGGQPYLSQKLARSISREQPAGDISENVDRIATLQLAGRAALHSEPHMSHIHREVVNDKKRCEALLNLYGRIRKGIEVTADFGSPIQRRLIAIGLIVIDEEGNLAVRNRLYRAVFTARWANENLKINWRTPAIAAVVLLVIIALPFWYTQLLPKTYVKVLTSDTVALEVAQEAFVNMRSFPGHVAAADNLYRSFLKNRAKLSTDVAQISVIANMASDLPDAGRLPDELRAGFWDMRVRDARRAERRDDALFASLESLVLSTPQRRNSSAMLLADDYPLLLASLADNEQTEVVFNPDNLLLTATRGAEVSQWSLQPQGLQRREEWVITALEVSPLVRRVIVDQQGTASRIGLTLNLSHARAADLRIKVIAPSGRAVEVYPNVERASPNEDLRIPATQLRELVGEPLNGTWSLSVRDEELGVGGRLVGWNLNLNSQGLVEDFQRGLNIPDPVETGTDNLWLSSDGRFAVARAMQSDSARVWDLAFAKPVRAVAVNELEQLIGLSAGARLLVTATQDTVNLWDTATGKRVAMLPVGAASTSSVLTTDGAHLLVQRRSDSDTTFELWSLDSASIGAKLEIAGTPALVSVDSSGSRIAIADYDRAVRVWDFRDGSLLAQIDLAAQPSEITLAASGQVLGAVFGEEGVSLWRMDRPPQPLLEEFGEGRWQLAFSPSGSKALVGRSGQGFQVYDSADGRLLGPRIRSAGARDKTSLLAFSADEQIIVTGGADSAARFWRAPKLPAESDTSNDAAGDSIWPPSGDAVAVSTPDAATIIIGDQRGNVHMLAADLRREALVAKSQEVSFFGHSVEVRRLEVSADGALVASAAADNSLRIWNTADGLPRPFIGSIVGDPIDRLAFSPESALLGVLNGNSAEVIDTTTGTTLTRFDLGERHNGMAFADRDHLYLGSESGALRVIVRGSGDSWDVQTLWQSDVAIRWLEASPRSQFLVLVDQNNLAQQFSLAEGRIGEMVLHLPSAVEEVTFTPGGLRVLFRTSNWIHRASSSRAGLVWIDALLAPKALNSARMVFGDPATDNAAALGNHVFLPVAGDGFAQLEELGFAVVRGPGLFGNKDQLLEEWRRKLAVGEIARAAD